jgi:hypothetical protein
MKARPVTFSWLGCAASSAPKIMPAPANGDSSRRRVPARLRVCRMCSSCQVWRLLAHGRHVRDSLIMTAFDQPTTSLTTLPSRLPPNAHCGGPAQVIMTGTVPTR